MKSSNNTLKYTRFPERIESYYQDMLNNKDRFVDFHLERDKFIHRNIDLIIELAKPYNKEITTVNGYITCQATDKFLFVIKNS